MSKISIVMPIYNAAEFLTESIDDIRKQTFTDWELICVNDGSTDGCGQILADYEAVDSRIKVITQDNLGGGAARNNGLKTAQGKYVLFLDADDRFDETLLNDVFENAEANQSDIVIFGADCFDYSSGKVRAATWLLDESCEKSHENIYNITNGTVWNKLFRREFLQINQLTFQENYSADCIYFVMVSLAIAKDVSFLDKILVHYRENVPSGQVANNHKNPLGAYLAVLAVKERLDTEEIFNKFRKSFLDFSIKFCIERFSRLAEGKAQEILYNELHNGGFEKLGLTFRDSSELSSESLWNKCCEIKNLEYVDYLHQQQRIFKQMINKNGAIYLLPNNIPTCKKVAIYGGGNVGKSYFAHLSNSSEYRLVGWFDKNYEKIGYPILSPELLSTIDFDIVIIAVTMLSITNEIKKDLMLLGVPETKIFWEEPKML